MPIRIVCSNKKQDGTRYDLYRSDLDGGCSDCYFLETHKGKHYLDDWARCTGDMKYQDKVDIFPLRIKKVRKYKKRRINSVKNP